MLGRPALHHAGNKERWRPLSEGSSPKSHPPARPEASSPNCYNGTPEDAFL